MMNFWEIPGLELVNAYDLTTFRHQKTGISVFFDRLQLQPKLSGQQSNSHIQKNTLQTLPIYLSKKVRYQHLSKVTKMFFL